MADNAVKLGLILSATDHMSRVIATAMDKSKAKTRAFENSIKSINAVSNKMFISGGVMAAGIFKTIQAAEEGQASERKLANVFKTMWGDNGEANKAAKAANEYAEKLSLLIGVDDDVIRTTQAKLATFAAVSSKTAVMNGIFERATKAAHDMAAVGFGDAATNAVMLGKALQDPLTMATAMKRTGALNTQDVLNVQNIYKSKGLLAAQKAILEAVERQVKGTGIATVKSTEIMKVAFGKVTEAIGGAFLPSVDKAKNGVMSFFEPTIKWINENHKLIRTIAKIAIGMLALAAAIRITTFTIMTIRKVMVLWNVAMGITAFFTKAMPLAMKSNVIALKTYATAMKIAQIMQWLFNISLYGCPIVWIIAGIMAVIAAVVLIVKFWKPIVAFFKKIWEGIKNIFAPIKNWFKGIADLFRQGGWGIVKGLAKGIWDMWTFPYRMIGKLGKLLVDKFKSIFKINSPSGLMAEYGINITAGLAKGIDSGSAKSAQSMNKLSGKVDNSFSSNQSSVGGASLVYAPVINLGNASATDKDSFAKMLQNHKREIYQLLVDMDNNKKRVSFT